jgi:hypothetical protein
VPQNKKGGRDSAAQKSRNISWNYYSSVTRRINWSEGQVKWKPSANCRLADSQDSARENHAIEKSMAVPHRAETIPP